MHDPRPILIFGPTASGKSALALALAERLCGVVLNADALQVYADFRVLTARPTPEDEARAPHRLYGHVDAAEPYSVGRWLDDLAAALAEARAADLTPILAGGTGLYLEAATRGLAAIPPVSPEIRAEAEARLAALGASGLAAELARLDPATAAGLDAANPRRLTRAWEVLRATGRGLAAWAAETGPPLLAPGAVRRLLLSPDTERLDARIAKRFTAMLEAGATAEVAAFEARRARGAIAPDAPAGKALGRAEIAALLEGRMARAEAAAAATLATRRYAKRQRTWARGRLADWPAVAADAQGSFDFEAILDRLRAPAD